MKKTFIIILVATFLSCNNSSQEEYKIIEDIQLGISLEDFNSTNDSLKIKNNEFYTKWFFNNYQESDINKISSYYTTLFDFEEFKNPKNNTNHYGLIIPQLQKESKIVYSVNILLGNTINATGLNKEGKLFNLTDITNKKTFVQFVPDKVIENISSMLTAKYGEPISKSESNEFFLIENNDFLQKNHSEKKGQKTTWETKNYKIILFHGFVSKVNLYDYSSNSYIFGINEFDSLKENEKYTKIYPYIKYELKEEITQELLKKEFNKIKL